MIHELVPIPEYLAPYGVNSLYNANNRRDLGERGYGSFEDAVIMVRELGMGVFKEHPIGNNRVLRVSVGSFSIPSFVTNNQDSVKLGFAGEYVSKSDDQQPKSIIVRESLDFEEEDFVRDAKKLMRYNRRAIPRYLRGVGIGCLGPIGGLAAGLVGGAYLTGDGPSAFVAGVSSGAIGIAFADYLNRLDQWGIEQEVPKIKEYYSNDLALYRLEHIALQWKTIQFVGELEKALEKEGLVLDKGEVKKLWKSQAVSEMIDSYNVSLKESSMDESEAKAQLLSKIVVLQRESS